MTAGGLCPQSQCVAIISEKRSRQAKQWSSRLIYGKVLSDSHEHSTAAQKQQQQQQKKRISTVRLLITGTSTATTEPEDARELEEKKAGKGWRAKGQHCELQSDVLLGLAAAGVSHEKGAVVRGEDVLGGA